MSYHPQTEIIEKGFECNILNTEKIDLINHGRNPHSYFETSPASHDFHNEYYFIFKILPAMPVFLRKKLTYSAAQKIPYFIKLPIFIYAIFYLAIKHRSPRIKLFITLYLKQMMWILKSKFFSEK
jgi:hypothetical protein